MIDYKFPVMPGFEQPVSDTFNNGHELTIHRVQQDGYCAKFSYRIAREGHLVKSGTFDALGGMGTTMEQEFHKFVNQIYDRYHR
jgi:hypothetical protein